MPQGFSTPFVAGSAEVGLNSAPHVGSAFNAVTNRADDAINRCLEEVQLAAFGRPVAGGLKTHVLVGVGTREEPWVGVESNARILLSEKGRPLRLRTRVVCNSEMKVCIIHTRLVPVAHVLSMFHAPLEVSDFGSQTLMLHVRVSPCAGVVQMRYTASLS